MIALEVFEALLAEGGTLAQAVAMMRADRDRLIRRRCERAVKAALFPVERDRESGIEPANPDSGVRVVHEAAGAATAGSGSTKGTARAALLMRHGLTPAARKVGGHIIESFNLSTGRCFPSIETLRQASGLNSERSVRRALAELDAAGLVARRIHGAGRANSYQPNWPALRAAATAAGNSAAEPNMNNPDSAPTRTLSSAIPDERVRQNLRSKPIRESGGGGRHRARGPDPRQREFLYPMPPAAKADAAYGAASTRLWQAISTHLKAQDAAYRDRFIRISEHFLETATLAEMRHRGTGLLVLLKDIDAPRPVRGPPQAAGTG